MALIDDKELENLLKNFEKSLTNYNRQEKKEITRAAWWASEQHKEQKRASGEPYMIHPLAVAETLVNLRMDAPTIIAGLLHDVLEDTEITEEELTELFSQEVTTLVNGVTKINIVNAESKTMQESETIRKMFLAMVDDIRVILIKLADKKHNMSTLNFLREEKQKTIAKECLDIYAPLAGKLGIYGLKSELEDASLKYLERATYSEIKAFVDQKKKERQNYLEEIEKKIIKKAREQRISITIKSRAKHFYSIFNKMKSKNKELTEIHDLLGIRILCSTTAECYSLLGIVHSLWNPISGRFKDYIAMPKENNYQSLHTTVMGEKGRTFEIQIRTVKMNQTAEYGIAAHWLYKKGRTTGHIVPKELALINKLKTWKDVKLDSSEFINSIIGDLLQDSIYVYTPKGDIVELPRGATALDFAYHIHTDIGNTCMGAKANNNIIALTKPLKNTQIISIITSPNAHPHVNWLKHVKTTRAKNKIRHWLNTHDDFVIVERSVVIKNAKEELKAEVKEEKEIPEGEINHQKVYNKDKVSIKIGDENNVLVSFANCCSPTVGDDIVGFVSRGRGIIVHRKSCPNLNGINEFEERQIDVSWEAMSAKSVKKYVIKAHRVPGIFSEIEGALRKHKAHLISGTLDETERGNLEGKFTIEMENSADDKKILKNIRAIPSITYVQEKK